MPQHPALTEGRVAVITGGASGIGLAAAKRFASLGMKLVLADLRQEALDHAVAQLPGATVVTVPTDVSKSTRFNTCVTVPAPRSAPCMC
jgi:NAD(P)-dependent dehydrogenase (short-subunit alcohol dehydrogenase family)